MIHRVSAMNISQNLEELLNGVQSRQDVVLITKSDKPIAALVGIELFEKMVRMREEFETLSKELALAYQGVPEAIANAEIAEALEHVRKSE